MAEFGVQGRAWQGAARCKYRFSRERPFITIKMRSYWLAPPLTCLSIGSYVAANGLLLSTSHARSGIHSSGCDIYRWTVRLPMSVGHEAAARQLQCTYMDRSRMKVTMISSSTNVRWTCLREGGSCQSCMHR